MRYIKALIKTIKQMDKTDRSSFLGFSSLIFGICNGVISEIIELEIFTFSTFLFVLLGFYLIFKAMWEEDLRDDLVKFIKKVKGNLD